MPKQTAYAITWSPTTLRYHLRDPHHAKTLAALYGNHLVLDPNSQEWFDWLAPISSFAFAGQTGRFTARREEKQRGENYWSTGKYPETLTFFAPNHAHLCPLPK